MPLFAGAGAVKLEPPVGAPMGGYGGRQGVSAGIHDDLQARALVLRSGEQMVGLVVCDLVALDPSTVETFRTMAARECDIPTDRLMVAVTHTHSGPAYGSFLTRYMSGLSGDEAERLRFPDWEEALPRRMLDAVLAARRDLQPARLAVGRGEARAGVHRRLRDAGGEIRLHPNPDGPIDPEVLVLRLESPEGKSIATLVNYACHGVALCEDNLLHSADFPHYLRERLEALDGGVAIFLNGACGNINPLIRGDFAAAQWVGTTLADAAHAALQGAERSEEVNLGGGEVWVELPAKPLPSETEIERYLGHARTALAIHADPDNFEGRRRAAEVQRAEAQAARLRAQERRLSLWGITAGRIPAQIQVLHIGDTDIVGLPGEIFVELGTAIKAAAGGRQCLVAGYCNRSVGYVPTQAAYAEGGYEVNSNFLTPGAGEEMVLQAIRLMQELRSQGQR